MSRGANRHAGASPPRSGAERRCGRQPCAGFVFFDLLIVLVILGFLAAVIAPRYYAPDFSGQARLHAARSALATRTVPWP
jgi:Tfp pilus assembly protein PilE